MSDRSHPRRPARRRRLSEGGRSENRYSSDPDVAPDAADHSRSRADTLRELLSRDARDAVAVARNAVTGANMLHVESNTQNQLPRMESTVTCINALLDDPRASDSPTSLLRAIRSFRLSWGQRVQNLNAAVSEAAIALEQEVSMRRNAEVEVCTLRATCAATSPERERASARIILDVIDTIRHQNAHGEGLAELGRSRVVRDENVAILVRNHRELEAALSSALERETARAESAEHLGEYHREMFTSALHGLKRERAGREAAVAERRDDRASYTSALAGLQRERTLREDQARASATALGDAEGALQEERVRRETVEDHARCVICMTHNRNVVLLPCTHLVLCDRCPRVSSCPICRARVEGTMSVILS